MMVAVVSSSIFLGEEPKEEGLLSHPPTRSRTDKTYSRYEMIVGVWKMAINDRSETTLAGPLLFLFTLNPPNFPLPKISPPNEATLNFGVRRSSGTAGLSLVAIRVASLEP